MHLSSARDSVYLLEKFKGEMGVGHPLDDGCRRKIAIVGAAPKEVTGEAGGGVSDVGQIRGTGFCLIVILCSGNI